jgi:glyoxylase-like metal-dependent hydrolase (beta-lactamase superfamily II)
VSGATAGVERIIDGEGPLRLDDDLLIIPVPGHTRGSMALLYRDEFLFTGDHLWANDEQDALEMSRSVCWYSWREQVKSLEKLLAFRFRWVLPGHGRRFHAETPEKMRDAVAALLGEIRGQSSA